VRIWTSAPNSRATIVAVSLSIVEAVGGTIRLVGYRQDDGGL
jgi:hypothetical protein